MAPCGSQRHCSSRPEQRRECRQYSPGGKQAWNCGIGETGGPQRAQRVSGGQELGHRVGGGGRHPPRGGGGPPEGNGGGGEVGCPGGKGSGKTTAPGGEP